MLRILFCFRYCRSSFMSYTICPKKYAHGFCFAVLCCGYTLTDFPISIRLTSLALWQSNDCPSASKATLLNMDKYFMWIRYERLHNHNKAKHNNTVCIFLGIYGIYQDALGLLLWYWNSRISNTVPVKWNKPGAHGSNWQISSNNKTQEKSSCVHCSWKCIVGSIVGIWKESHNVFCRS